MVVQEHFFFLNKKLEFSDVCMNAIQKTPLTAYDYREKMQKLQITKISLPQ